MASRYGFTEYSRDWPRAFKRQAASLREILGEALIDIHHIGSTSVPGLAAKPVIDLLPVVRDIREARACDPSFESAGYCVWGEYGIPGRHFLTRDLDGIRVCNVHIFASGDPGIERHLAFCAYLRAHSEVAGQYEALKREAYSQHPEDITAYSDHKGGWIQRVEPLAVEWWRARLSGGDS